MDPVKKEEKRKLKKDELLNHAVKLFAQKGYINTTIKMIADDADIAVGTVYIYYESKESIMMAVFRRFIDNILKEMREKIETADSADEKLRRLIEVHLRFFAENEEMGRLFLIELRQTVEMLRDAAQEVVRKYIALIKDVLDEGVEQGIFRSINTRVAASAVFGALDSFLLGRFISKDENHEPEKALEVIPEIFFKGLYK